MDDTILKLVMIVLYVLMPAVWFGLLGFAGYKVHGVSFDTALDKVNQVTQVGVKTLTGTAAKQMK